MALTNANNTFRTNLKTRQPFWVDADLSENMSSFWLVTLDPKFWSTSEDQKQFERMPIFPTIRPNGQHRYYKEGKGDMTWQIQKKQTFIDPHFTKCSGILRNKHELALKSAWKNFKQNTSTFSKHLHAWIAIMNQSSQSRGVWTTWMANTCE